MKPLRPLVFAVVGGLVVAGAFLALGVTGRRSTQTVVQEAPVAAQPVTSSSQRLTLHNLYERNAPGVLFISAQERRPVRDPFEPNEGKSQGVSTGSGFLLNRSGDIITTYDVVDGADADDGVSVQIGDGPAVRAVVLGTEPSEDLAVLKVAPTSLPDVAPLQLGDSTTVRVGDPALAIANPFGSERTLSSGIVSALQTELPGPGGTTISNVIMTQMPVYPGSSGGPLLDAGGRVIGVNSQMRTVSGRVPGQVAFAIPIDTAKELVARVVAGH
ncbi:MAG TPA: trypsin-like peptidase domain-containing protein [Solirubrobacteraceae bacterium]|nr:trypsin-like peptidase domain-containing protein [Solirubrobacteraceae bacterium]